MKNTILVLAVLFTACINKEVKVQEANETVEVHDTVQVKKTIPMDTISKNYANERFRNVTVQKMNDTAFRIRGEGQIFEASFNWSVEDGHYELKKGYEMTDMGAPEWGKFDFTIDVKKIRENSTLTLILFESSAKDGSRQYELPIPLL